MLLFDAGTGLRYLGNELLKSGPVDTDLFLTHTHFDHVCGLPFFVPLFIKTSQIRIWAGHLKAREMTVKYVISEMMFSPLFPVPPEIFTANVSYLDFDAGETLEPKPGVKLRTARLNHPDRATGPAPVFHHERLPEHLRQRLRVGPRNLVVCPAWREGHHDLHRGLRPIGLRLCRGGETEQEADADPEQQSAAAPRVMTRLEVPGHQSPSPDAFTSGDGFTFCPAH